MSLGSRLKQKPVAAILQVEQYGEEYQSQSWGPLIALVKGSSPPAGGSVTSAKDKATIKETLLTVNGYIQVCCMYMFESP